MAELTRVRAVLFDLDGTLLDTLPDLAYAINAVLDEHTRAPLPEAVFRPLISKGSHTMVAHAFPDVGEDNELETLRHRFLNRYRENVARRTRFFPGMEAVLGTIEARALPWGIVTNKHAAFTEPLLEALGVAARAGCIVSGDTVANAKPHPAPLLLASRQLLRQPSECVYVGDAENDVEAGRRAGMRTLIAGYGYVPPGADLTPWRADGILAAPADLIAWLDAHA